MHWFEWGLTLLMKHLKSPISQCGKKEAKGVFKSLLKACNIHHKAIEDKLITPIEKMCQSIDAIKKKELKAAKLSLQLGLRLYFKEGCLDQAKVEFRKARDRSELAFFAVQGKDKITAVQIGCLAAAYEFVDSPTMVKEICQHFFEQLAAVPSLSDTLRDGQNMEHTDNRNLLASNNTSKPTRKWIDWSNWDGEEQFQLLAELEITMKTLQQHFKELNIKFNDNNCLILPSQNIGRAMENKVYGYAKKRFKQPLVFHLLILIVQIVLYGSTYGIATRLENMFKGHITNSPCMFVILLTSLPMCLQLYGFYFSSHLFSFKELLCTKVIMVVFVIICAVVMYFILKGEIILICDVIGACTWLILFCYNIVVVLLCGFWAFSHNKPQSHDQFIQELAVWSSLKQKKDS